MKTVFLAATILMAGVASADRNSNSERPIAMKVGQAFTHAIVTAVAEDQSMPEGCDLSYGGVESTFDRTGKHVGNLNIYKLSNGTKEETILFGSSQTLQLVVQPGRAIVLTNVRGATGVIGEQKAFRLVFDDIGETVKWAQVGDVRCPAADKESPAQKTTGAVENANEAAKPAATKPVAPSAVTPAPAISTPVAPAQSNGATSKDLKAQQPLPTNKQ